MKTKAVYPLLAFAAALTGNCLALTPVLEEFTSGKLDETHFYQYTIGNGKLVQKGEKLNFTALSPTKDDFASVELLTSYPGIAESWQMTLDLTNTSNAGKSAGCGFMICNTGDRRDRLFVDFYGVSGIKAGIIVNDKDAPVGKLSAKVGLPKVSIRVRFDAATKLMAFSVSLTDKTEGYKWVKIGTFSPTGKGGNVRANWKMKADGVFGIQLYGFGHSNKIKAGKLTLDNLAVTSIP
ncbi:MAG: hypothetical protein ABIT37_10575 [Luteolibacter sp.]